jgi:serine phosphatase RsbU (regulator of sigma subunit)
MNSWRTNAEVWKKMPLASSVFFFAAVACLFSAQNLIFLGLNVQSQSLLEISSNVLVSGAFAIVWALAGTRRILWLFPVIAIVQTAAYSLLAHSFGSHHVLNSAELQHKLRVCSAFESVLIIAGYILFLAFFNREGARFFKTQTEVRLAGEIHRTLVPVRHQTIGNVELFGTSIPSSEVGGDIFDILQSDGRWHAYVADVSGHGVAAGILMSMIKSAASMQLTKLHKPAELLADLNDVMQPFTSPANYLTFAYVSGDGSDTLNFALAGHLPILHYQAKTKSIVEHSDGNVPIGLFQNQSFVTSQLQLSPGDLLAIITDGFTEIFDSKEKEIGMEDFKTMLLACVEKPLPEIYRDLRARTMQFGKQTDDQTMLLLRKLT